MGMGLAIIFFSLLPALIYSFIIYFTVPYKTINFREALPFIFVGFLSVGLLKYFWFFCPSWNNLAINLVDNEEINPFKYYHAYYFIQVAFIEELSKLIIFLLYARYRRNTIQPKDHPIATMFFCGMISLGFSVIENIQYANMSISPMDTLWWRSITAVIGHMVFGFFMGYWIAIGRLGARRFDRSLLDIVIHKKTKIRRFIYTSLGLFSAILLHGIYDLHIEINGPPGITGLYMLLVASLLGTYWCFKNLNNLHNKKIDYLKRKADI